MNQLRPPSYPPGKAFRSKLCPHTNEILRLKFQEKYSNRKIVAHLWQRFGIKVCRSTLESFIKVRVARTKPKETYPYITDTSEKKQSTQHETTQIPAMEKKQVTPPKFKSEVAKPRKKKGRTVDEIMREAVE